MTVVKVTADDDTDGFEVEVEPFELGLISKDPGFYGIGPGQPKKVYVDGKVHWASRRRDHLALLAE